MGARGGRKSKYTPERAERVLAALKIGVPRRHAAAYAGVSEDTLLRWIKRYADFAARVDEAEAQAVATWASVVHYAASVQQDWRAAAWLLERRAPQEYQMHRLDVAASGEIKIVIVDQTMPLPDLPRDHDDDTDTPLAIDPI